MRLKERVGQLEIPRKGTSHRSGNRSISVSLWNYWEKYFYSTLKYPEMIYYTVEMLDFTLKNLLIYTVKMSNINCVGSQRGPEHSHISLTLELLGKVFL